MSVKCPHCGKPVNKPENRVLVSENLFQCKNCAGFFKIVKGKAKPAERL